MDFQALMEHLQSVSPTLPPQLMRAAMELKSHPDDVALRSMRELAAQCGISPATFTRLAHSLGFPDFVSLREVFVTRMRNGGGGGFVERATLAKKLVAKGHSPDAVHKLSACIGDNVRVALSADSLVQIKRAAKLLHKAHEVHLIGARSCASLVLFTDYAARLFGDKVRPAFGLGDTFVDSLRYASDKDVVLVATFDPYARRVIDMLADAATRGCKIIYLTDNSLAPGSEHASVILSSPVAVPSFLHSLAGPMAILDCLLLDWMLLDEKQAIENIAMSDRGLARQSTYIRSQHKRRLP